MQERQSLTEYFRSVMLTVLGQAFAAAGYTLQENRLKWINGQFRFVKTFDEGTPATIEFQVLVYSDNMWVTGQPSRFRVSLRRGDVQKTLGELVVNDFGVAILPGADHWWQFHDTDSLGKALAEAGHLAVGYGIPWLAGDLKPGEGL